MTTVLLIGLGLFVLPLAAGFAATLITSRRIGIAAPALLTALVLVAYGGLLLYQAVWALSDWNGSVLGDDILHPLGIYNEDVRREFFRLTVLILAIPTVHLIAGIWTAALISRRLNPTT